MISSPAGMPSEWTSSRPRPLLVLVTVLLFGQQLGQTLQTFHGAHAFGSATNGPRIEIKPSVPVVLFEAQTISNKVLTCKALGDKPGMFNQLRWSGPNRMDNWEELSKRHKVRETTRNGYSVELEFNKPSTDDSGTYYCQGIYQSSDYHNASISVKVFNPIKLENCPERQFVIENRTGQKITCRITGDSPSLVFSKDDTVLDLSNKRYKWDNVDSLEILGPANQIDAGVYTIQVTTDVTGDRRLQRITVEVHSEPKISPLDAIKNDSLADFTGIEGEKVELRCNATGDPAPLIYWLDPRLRNLTSVGGYFVNPERGSLLISKVNRVDDNGNFLCVAHNHVGEARRNVSMVVLQRPNVVMFENRTVEEGFEALLECRATGFPRPTFSIRRQGLNQSPYHIGDGLVTDIDESEEGGGAQVYVYRVKVRANRSQFGPHYCNATNLAGTSDRLGMLSVKYKPDLSRTPSDQYVKLGKNVTVTCHVMAYPQPQVTFHNEFGQQILNAPIETRGLPDDQTHTVTMLVPPNVQASSGRFKCLARNEMGEREHFITIRYKTVPGIVNVEQQDVSPTTVKLRLSVSNDGGDRIRAFKYKADGTTNDRFNPIYTYPIDAKPEASIDASSLASSYTIRNLYPDFTYKIRIFAINDVGPGGETEFTIQTRKPSAPDSPIIIKPSVSSSALIGFTSDYQNGYLLRWSPPELDNGDPVTRYIIKIQRVNPDFPDVAQDEGEQRIIEQSNERPLHAKIGPLEINQHYRIQLQARNKFGDSEPSKITIYTNADRPPMPDFEPQALSWLTEPSTPVLVCLLTLAIISLVIIDTVFCLCFHIGVGHSLRSCCCPAKANSVISDKTYN